MDEPVESQFPRRLRIDRPTDLFEAFDGGRQTFRHHEPNGGILNSHAAESNAGKIHRDGFGRVGLAGHRTIKDKVNFLRGLFEPDLHPVGRALQRDIHAAHHVNFHRLGDVPFG